MRRTARIAAALAVGLCLAACSSVTTPGSTAVRDLEGRPLDPLRASDARAVVLVFVDP